MFINSVEVRNLLSFGPQQQSMQNFKTLNLFIGVNGSGKSNALRLIGDIAFEHDQLQAAININTGSGRPVQSTPIFRVKLKEDLVSNRLPNRGLSGLGDLTVRYTDCRVIAVSNGNAEVIDVSPHVVQFRNGSLCQGDFSTFVRRSRLRNVSSDWDDIQFCNSLRDSDDFFQTNGVLIFGLRYIFERDYIVGPGAYFAELHTRLESGGRTANGGPGGFDKSLWPDGVLRVAKIIQQVSRLGNVTLMEEPGTWARAAIRPPPGRIPLVVRDSGLRNRKLIKHREVCASRMGGVHCGYPVFSEGRGENAANAKSFAVLHHFAFAGPAQQVPGFQRSCGCLRVFNGLAAERVRSQ